jgi:diacylglycerol kinase family enzyme
MFLSPADSEDKLRAPRIVPFSELNALQVYADIGILGEPNQVWRGLWPMPKSPLSMTRSNSVPIIINQQGGTASRAGDALKAELTELFAAHGVVTDIQMVDGQDMFSTVERFLDRPLIVVGGGDGTLGSAAAMIFRAGNDTILGILPLGTRNHLARDLGIPPALKDAVKLIVEGHLRRIDLARVGDVIFVNNASIGLYPQMVRVRDLMRNRFGLPKWLAMFVASGQVFARLHSHRLDVKIGEQWSRVRSPLMFIGNNRYALDAGNLGQRARLDEGKLSVFVIATRSRAGALAAALRMMVGRADPERDFVESGFCGKVGVESSRAVMTVALDGEVLRLKSPLIFEILPGVLSVIAPLDEAGTR